MSNQKVAAGIVLFNPDNVNRVLECIKSVESQVERIFIFDNSTKKIDINFEENIIYMKEGKNKGIAYALNRIMEKAETEGFSWVLTMDQDSILPKGMMEDFDKYIDSDLKIGIICPQVIDKRRAYMKVDRSEDAVAYLDKCITSASCTSIKAWKMVGGFDEWLFIDLVDNEFCKRLRASGFNILQIKKWVLDQEFGKIIPKSSRKQKFWLKLSNVLHSPNVAKMSYTKWVSPLRVYYTCRNIIYVNRKMKFYGKVGYSSYNCKNYAGFLIAFVAPSFLRAQDKRKVFKAIVRGTKDGIKHHVEPWQVQSYSEEE